VEFLKIEMVEIQEALEGTSRDEAMDRPLAYEEIARLAYSYWEARGNDADSPDDGDWFWAERELRSRRAMMGRESSASATCGSLTEAVLGRQLLAIPSRF
jgi:hypothetical protein